MNKIKVVWVACFSSKIMRERIGIRIPWYENLIRKIINQPSININTDTCIWNSYGVEEFEKFNEIELTIICPYFYLRKKEEEFIHNGVRYYLFKDECDNLLYRIKRRFFGHFPYKKNTSRILNKISEINPDIIHFIGAENPNYDMAAIHLQSNTPLVVQLQTLMGEKGFSNNYEISSKEYAFRSAVEYQVIKRADYIGISAEHFRNVIEGQLKLNKKYLDIYLALTEPVNDAMSPKEYDFIYFANDISKSFDVALEAFQLAKKRKKDITLDVVGNFTPEYKLKIDVRINELEISNSVFFEGRLPSHDDVIKQIRKSRFAILPLKVDLISGTIREAIANSIPVITTITPDTPKLNMAKECVLLSPKDDIQSLADHMVRLCNDPVLEKQLIANALELASNRPSNYEIMKKWVESYKTIITQ